MNRLLFLVALLFSMAANAQSSPAKLALAKELTALLQFDSMFDAYLTQCSQPKDSSFDPKAEFRSSPGSFGGVSPQSAYWPEVEAIYGRFRTTACAYATPEKFADYFSEQFAERISEDDLRTSLTFYSSPAGRRLQGATIAANRD
jgi:hypothetical protein